MHENYKWENSNPWNEILRTVRIFTYCRFEQPKAQQQTIINDYIKI